MSMNYFAFFPALANEATNPHAEGHRLLRQPARTEWRPACRARRPGHLDHLATRKNQEEAYKFLEWFIKDEMQKKWAELGGYTCSAAVLESEEFLNATPYNQAFAESMKIVKDFWAVPEFADMLFQMNERLHPYITLARAPPRKRWMRSPRDWNKTLRQLTPRTSDYDSGTGGSSRSFRFTTETQGRLYVAVLATLDSGSRAAARGWSDLTIRNLFIIPTIAFLIIFNIFPLIYSLGFSFTEYRASLNKPAEFVGLQNYRRAARPIPASGAISPSPRNT